MFAKQPPSHRCLSTRAVNIVPTYSSTYKVHYLITLMVCFSPNLFQTERVVRKTVKKYVTCQPNELFETSSLIKYNCGTNSCSNFRLR